MPFPNHVASNYRTGRNANEFYCYGGVFESPGPSIEITIRADSYFLLKKVHAVNFVNITASVIAVNFRGKLQDTSNNRVFQSGNVLNQVMGGNCHSPNVLPAPILFHPASVIRLDMDRSPTRVHLCLEGEKIYDPDPAWVQKMMSRFWYQHQLELTANTSAEIATLDIKDPNYDFAIFRVLSGHFTNGILSNTNPGFIRIQDRGPGGYNWSNEEVPNVNFAGVFGNGAGARIIQPPIVLPGTSSLEIQTRSIPTSALQDLVFDGVKFPRGTALEDWL